jgi:crossover junction endodeoxyribonuclease RuvC
VLLLAAQLERATLHEYAPRAVKLATVGNGGASKEQVQAMIPRLLGDCRTGLAADEADALAVAWCCANQIRTVRPAVAGISGSPARPRDDS